MKQETENRRVKVFVDVKCLCSSGSEFRRPNATGGGDMYFLEHAASSKLT